MTRFSVLGAMECWFGQRPVLIVGPLQRTLLAALLASERKPVSVDALVFEMWADSPPPQPENALQAHVSRLRRRLQQVADDRPAHLIAQPSAYHLLVDPDAVDALVFVRDVSRALSQIETDPAWAVENLRSALSLWRGQAFDLVVCGPLCRAAASRYEAARLGALETLFDLELHLGRHGGIIPALTELVESSALNERFCEQLMIALYRSGRQKEALVAYRRMRTRLDEELGVQPTVTLQNHERAILSHDPALRIRADHLVLRS